MPLPGIIIMPSIFGISSSTKRIQNKLKRIGYRTKIVNFYDNKELYAKNGLRAPHTPSITKRDRNIPIKTELSNLVSRFRKDIVFSQINIALKHLSKQGCREFICIADGFGSTLITLYLESKSYKKNIKRVFMWFPHVKYNTSYLEEKISNQQLDEPLLNDAYENIDITVFHGDSDSIVEPKNLKILKDWATNNRNVELIIYPEADHSFSTKFTQGWIPNIPFYWFHKANRKAHKDSWDRVYKELERIANEE